LANQPNVDFVVNEFDPTIGSFRIGNKLFISVHGDMEKDLKTTATVIEKAIGTHIDYLLAGHMHVPEMRVEDTTYIRNGCVCGSGDDYTVKKRLFSPPCQVFMVIGQDGSVRSVYTVNLENVMPYEMRKAQ
jgi:predicted phosphodiesterase